VNWTVIIRPRAEEDISNARMWYEKRQTGLGDRLVQEISRAIKTLETDADRFPLYYRTFRRILLPRFPYKLFYLLDEKRAIIFRVLHAKQKHQLFLPTAER
jgi:toxin ParE1/3/4